MKRYDFCGGNCLMDEYDDGTFVLYTAGPGRHRGPGVAGVGAGFYVVACASRRFGVART